MHNLTVIFASEDLRGQWHIEFHLDNPTEIVVKHKVRVNFISGLSAFRLIFSLTAVIVTPYVETRTVDVR
jgi:hypothetical protein